MPCCCSSSADEVSVLRPQRRSPSVTPSVGLDREGGGGGNDDDDDESRRLPKIPLLLPRILLS